MSVTCMRRGVRRAIALEPTDYSARLRSRLRGPRRQSAVRGTRHFHQRGRHAAQLQRFVVLLGIADGGAEVLLANDHKVGVVTLPTRDNGERFQ